MAKLVTIILAALAVLVFAVVTASATDLSASVTAADRCLVCHPRAHAENWRDSHSVELAADPQQGGACTRCHPATFCDDCHNAATAGGDASGYASAQELVDAVCSGCHSAAIVHSVRKDGAGWGATIDRMVGHGLSVDESQKTMIVEYLSTQSGQ